MFFGEIYFVPVENIMMFKITVFHQKSGYFGESDGTTTPQVHFCRNRFHNVAKIVVKGKTSTFSGLVSAQLPRLNALQLSFVSAGCSSLTQYWTFLFIYLFIYF